MLKSILVPVDGSTHAEKAVHFAADLAEKYGAALKLLHVVRDLGSDAVPPELRTYVRQEHAEVTERDVIKIVAGDVLQKARQQAEEHGASKVETEMDVGAPAERILKAAEAGKVDLIVMGTRGLSDLKGLLMGSTAHKVSHLAPCTCITVR